MTDLLLFHAKISTVVLCESIIFDKGTLITKQVHAFPCCKLALKQEIATTNIQNNPIIHAKFKQQA